MATFVSARKDSNDTSGTNLDTAATVAVQAGDLICVLFKHEGTAVTISASDGGVNTYTGLTAVSHTNNDLNARLLWAIASTTTSLTVRGTVSSARAFRRMHVVVFRPAASKTWQLDSGTDVQSSASASVTAIAEMVCGSMTTSGAGAAVEAFFEYFGGDFDQIDGNAANWTNTGAAGINEALSAYRLVAGAETVTPAQRCTAGSGQYVGVAAHFKEIAAGGGNTLVCAQASFTLTGNATGLTAQFLLTAVQVGYSLTGVAATLTFSSLTSNTLVCDVGLFVLTGVATALNPQSPPGFYVLTGNDIGLLYTNRFITADVGTFALNGQAIVMTAAHVLALGLGSYSLFFPSNGMYYSGGGGGPSGYKGKLTCVDVLTVLDIMAKMEW